MWYQIVQYIKFLFKSTNQHGVHSPFVYDLVTKCFYDKTKHPEYTNILQYRNGLIKNTLKIDVTDLGVGSSKTKSNIRSVSNMAKHAGTTFFRAKLLFRLVQYFNSKNILELGTSLGIATQAMSLGNPKAHITSIEGCPNLFQFSKNKLTKLNSNIHLINNDFRKALKDVNNKSFNLVFFDGNHNRESTLEYFETLLTTVHNDSVFIFDDIYWSKDMTRAWEDIKKHPKTKVTIDTFFWGLVFFRKEQNKEHFTIRL